MLTACSQTCRIHSEQFDFATVSQLLTHVYADGFFWGGFSHLLVKLAFPHLPGFLSQIPYPGAFAQEPKSGQNLSF